MHKWIKVDERLPDQTGRYLIFEEKGEHMHNLACYSYRYPCCEPNIAYFTNYDNLWHFSSLTEQECKPTHWMNLPEEPKKIFEGD